MVIVSSRPLSESAVRQPPEQTAACSKTKLHHHGHETSNRLQIFSVTRPFFHLDAAASTTSTIASQGNRILAFSVNRKEIDDSSTLSRHEDRFLKLKRATLAGRVLLSDRKGWTEHLTTPNLVKSVVRVSAIQSCNMFATYVQDQFQADFAREELVKEGKLSAKKADEQQEEWEQAEWDRRINELPQKILIGLGKLHAITLLMRCYEFIAERWFDEFTLDRLTMDPFDAALRSSQRSRTSRDLSREMYSTCLWANIVAYMADYSVHQIILTFTYYRYYQSRKKRNRTDRTDDMGPLMLSYLTKSTSLVVSRGVGLFASAFGGAWGSLFYPGWGTLIGSQLSDAIVASVFDELQPTVMKVQTP